MGSELPLEGVRVIDLSSAAVGPVATRYLADYGATVVKVESSVHPDILRISTPYAGGQAHPDRSGYFALFNAGKLSIALNLRTAAGREVALRLVAWADILVETFTPGVMATWGLDYESLKAVKPDLIMLSHSLQGQTGPRAPLRGPGVLVSALGGWMELTGPPQGEPLAPFSAYGDFAAWSFTLIAILAALDHRRRTGQGIHIDQSQMESALQLAIPALLDGALGGCQCSRIGNRDANAAPHGCYPCLGEDRWCAIAVTSDEEWQALCQALGRPGLGRERRFSTLASRKAHEEELDSIVEAWTTGRTPEEVMARLQAAGVPAGLVATSQDLMADPQLRERGFFTLLQHPLIGPYRCPASPFKLSATPGVPQGPSPLVGQHTECVLRELLRLSDEEIAAYAAQGAFE